MSEASGSVWRKWDLHIHTPASFHWNGGKRFKQMDDIEKQSSICTLIQTLNSSDVAAFAIMDYWTFDGYLEIRNHQGAGKSPACEKKIFPGMEFRIEAPVNYRLNCHILLDDKLSNQQLSDFKSRLCIVSPRGPVPLSNERLIETARALDPSKAEVHGYSEEHLKDETKLLELGCKTAVITRDSLRDSIRILPQGSVLIMMPYDTSNGLKELDWEKHPLDDNYFMQSAHFFETRDSENVNLFLGRETPANHKFLKNFQKTVGKPKPCVSGSDAHTFADYGKFPNGKATWIKGDVTFEGFKQTLFEPEFRVHIGEDSPLLPIYGIKKATFSFPENTSIAGESFCLRGNTEVFFSPNLTCLIGGRGTGKSMILNLLHEYQNPGKNRFLQEHQLEKVDIQSAVKKVDIQSAVKIDGTTNIEFLSQNEIEEFAVNEEKFTAAITSRLINLDTDGDIERARTALRNHLDDIEAQIARLNRRMDLAKAIDGKKKQVESLQSVVTFLQDPKYLELSRAVRDGVEVLDHVRSSRERLTALMEALQKLLVDFPTEPGKQTNGFTDFHVEVVGLIKGLLDRFSTDKGLVEARAQEANHTDRVRTLREQLDQFLQTKNLSQESLIGISRANNMLSSVSAELVDLQKELDTLNEKIKGFVPEQKYKDDFEKEYISQLSPINGRLAGLNDHVKAISLAYGFDVAGAKRGIVQEFTKRLMSADAGASFREDYMQDALFSVDPATLGSHAEFLGAFPSTKSKTALSIRRFLENGDEYDVYRLICMRNLWDADSYKAIKVSYDNRPLNLSSFGQRCTAAIVILLLLGNAPLVIDEPEAHLDSSLIANYLVDLVKKQKQSRQVIFATHNANFVINGDAELVNILTSNGDKTTTITPTTIENLDHREALIALEGGKEAFHRREQRYDVNKQG